MKDLGPRIAAIRDRIRAWRLARPPEESTGLAYTVSAILGWILVTWGVALLLGAWAWPCGIGLMLMAPSGLRPLARFLYWGVRGLVGPRDPRP